MVARLLGFRLLKADAAIVVAPAEMRAVAPAAPRIRSRPIGAGLATAEQYIDEAAATLAASQEIARSEASR